MKQSTIYGFCVLVNSIFAFHIPSETISPLSNELVQPLAKDHSTAQELDESRIFLDPYLLKLDRNDVRIVKRDTMDRKPIGGTEIVKGTTYKKSTIKPVIPTKRKPKTNDLLFEIVKQMIEEERNRRRFDLVHPKNSKFSQQEQLLWNKLRIKATEELLLHPKPRIQIPTERVYDSFKMDLEEITQGPDDRGELFAPLKDKLAKQFYLDKYSKMMGRTAAPY